MLEVHKVTMAWPEDLHAATAKLARANRRSFTAEASVALEEHLARNGITLATPEAFGTISPNDTTITTTED